MDTQSTVDGLTKYRTALTAREDNLLSELEHVRKLKEAADLTIREYLQWQGHSPAAETEAGSGLTVQDIAHCKTQMDVILEVAQRSEGYMRPRVTARLLMDAKLTDGKSVDSVAATIYHRVKASKDWEYHEPGTFRYLPFFADGTAEDQGPVSLYMGDLIDDGTEITLLPPDPPAETDNADPS